MADIAGVEHNERKAESSSPSTRLLDLLAGWSAFVSESEENGIVDPLLSADEIGALYQKAGALTELDGSKEMDAVRYFVLESILSALLHPPAKVPPKSFEPKRLA